MPASTTITVRIPRSLKKRIERITKVSGQSKSEFGVEALLGFLERYERNAKRA